MSEGYRVIFYTLFATFMSLKLYFKIKKKNTKQKHKGCLCLFFQEATKIVPNLLSVLGGEPERGRENRSRSCDHDAKDSESPKNCSQPGERL